MLSLKKRWISLLQETFEIMEIMQISASVNFFSTCGVDLRLDLLKCKSRQSGKYQKMERVWGFPHTLSFSSEGNLWIWVLNALPFECLAPSLINVLCAKLFVLQCVAVNNRMG